MKSRVPFLDLKGSIALLILAIGTAAFALIPDTLHSTTTRASAPTEAGGQVQFSNSKRGAKLPLFGLFLNASVTTDRQDYSPGDVVVISGSGFLANEAVSLQVTYVATFAKAESTVGLADASGHSPWTVTADQNGNISSSWLVENDSLGQTLLLTATGQSSGLQATHTFTDSVPNDFQQCANAAGGTLPNGQCGWLNGILQQNNSNNFETMSTLQRAILKQVTATAGNNHTLVFDDDWTKGGIHAYDFLTSWEQAIRVGADNGVPYVGLTTFVPNAGESASNTQTLSTAVACDESISAPGQTICNARHNQAFRIDVPAPDDAYVSHNGLAQDKINAYESKYGNRYVRIYGDAPFTSASFDPPVHSAAASGDTSDSGTTYTLRWQSASTVVVIEWGEHIASGLNGVVPNGGWGANQGASSISGGPYHVGMDSLDGVTIGSQDNQLKGADVHPPPPQGTITIIKDSIPNDGQDFAFTTTGGLTPSTFSLDDDGDATLPNSQQFPNLANGTYTVTETGGVTGWNLVKIDCVDPNGGTTTSVGTRTASINLSAGEAVTCTFTNVKPDAKIVLSPGTATNEVRHAHTITATVTQDDMLPAGAPGDGSTGFGPAPDGTLVTFSVTSGSATFVGGVNTCTTSGGTGQCSVQINSNSAGGNTIHATTTFSVAGVSLTRASGDGLSGDSPDATKTYVDAKINLTPATATNEVNHAHTITATVQQDDGIPAGAPGDSVTGFGPAPNGTTVTFSIVSGSATFVGGVNTCLTSAGTCTVQINSTGTGPNVIHATTTFSVGGQSLTRATSDGLAGDGNDVSKRYVDLRITGSPLTATNNVGVNHTFTFTVLQDDGLAANTGGGDATTGFGPAVGATVNTNLLNNTAGATYVGPTSCVTNASGQCTITITSSTPGGVDIHATTTFSVSGVSITRATGDGLSGDSANPHKDYVAGTIIIRKVTVPAGGTGFGFTTTGGLSPSTFSLNDGQNRTYTNVSPGSFSVAENDPTPGYDLTNINCSATTGSGTSATPTLGTRSVAITLAANGVVDCTFTNTKRGTIKVVKATNPAGGTGFTYTGDAAGTISDGGNITVNNLAPGTYTSVEAVKTGWDLTNLVCDDGASATPSTVSIANRTATFKLDPGETITCTFTNTQRGSIHVVKATNPAGGQAFAFTGDAAGTINDGQSIDVTNLVPGTYTSVEAVKAGWDLTNITCGTGGSGNVGTRTATFVLPAGGNITCTFTNVQRGSIHVVKATNPAGGQAFTFTGDAAGTINDGQSIDVTNLVPGTYTSVEAVKAGWDLTNITCGTGGSGNVGTRTATFVLPAGGNITCTFTNVQRGSIHVVKATNPAGGQSFTFTGDAAGTINDGQSIDVTNLVPGTYTSVEAVKAGWDLTNITCGTGGSGNVGTRTATFVLPAGGNITCTFTNVQRGSIHVVKATNPAGGQSFTFTGDAAGTINDGQSIDVTNLVPGTYTSTEAAKAGWDLTNITCGTGGSGNVATATATFNLPAGGNITCTFTNVQRGSIHVVKATNPAGGQAFTFTGNAAGTINDGQSIDVTNLVPGTYTSTETAKAGWDLTNITCGTGGSGNVATATATFNLPAGGNITCTFTNVQRGSIHVVKATNPAGGQAFTFTGNAAGTINDGQSIDVTNLVPGTYTSVEAVKSGWDLTNITCGTGGSGNVGTRTATFVLPAGGNITCTFTNVQRGSIHVVKATNPAGGTGFTFTGDAAGTINDGQSIDVTNLVPGTYTSVEAVKAGWDLTNITCGTGGSGNVGTRTATFVLPAGGNITCTFTNVQRGSIHVVKATVPSGGTGFTFTGDAAGTINDGQSIDVTNLVAGTYTSTESAKTGWRLTNISCTTGGSGDLANSKATFTLLPGGNITCTFTNSRLPVLRVQKTIQGQPETFHFSETGLLSNLDIVVPTQNGSVTSDPRIIDIGDYTVNEVNLPLNWMLTDHTCTSSFNGGTFAYTPSAIGGTFTARYGDDILCSFVDNQQTGATRTQGFWATHTVLTNAIWNGTDLPDGTSTITPVPVIGSADAYLCQPPTIVPPFAGVPITATPLPGQNQVLGGFWANIANSTRSNKKRNDLDKARMQFLQQYLAAVLNVHAFGTLPIPGTTLAQARAAYCGTDTTLIGQQKSLLAAYNESHDSVVFTPGASATPQESRAQADIQFWDTTYRLYDPTRGTDIIVIDGGKTTTKSNSFPTTNFVIMPGSTDEDPPATDSDKPKTVKKRGIE